MGQIGQPQPGHFDPPESPAECLVKLPSNLKDGTPTFSQVAKAKNTERMISRRNNKCLVLKNRFPRFDVASCHEKATHLHIELQRCWGGWQIKNHRFAWPLAHQVISVHCSVENKSQFYWEGKKKYCLVIWTPSYLSVETECENRCHCQITKWQHRDNLGGGLTSR